MTRQEKLEQFGKLLDIMDELREKCPWDKKQTLETLRHLTIEEVYELSDSIVENNLTEVRKELGDILLHIIFYAKIADERGAFDVGDVLKAQCEKLVHRHPHIYGNVTVQNEEEVKKNWEMLKLKEGKSSVLQGVPASLPALVKAMRIQEKARGAGFDWERPQQVWDKVLEELNELRSEAESAADPKLISSEFGDLIFSLVNYARFINVNPEEALERTNKKFIHRFMHMERRAAEEGKALHDMSLAEMDVYWEEAKKI